MELQINSLETRIEKMQDMFNEDLEEIKKSHSIMNNVINEMKRHRNTQQVKEQDKCPPNQTKEEEIGNLPEKNSK